MHVLKTISPRVFVTIVVSFAVPCTPQRVKYSGNWESAELSWDTSIFATSYTVYNVSGGGRVKLCNTTGLSCQLAKFDPDATEVTASNAAGESIPSQSVTGESSSQPQTQLLFSFQLQMLKKKGFFSRERNNPHKCYNFTDISTFIIKV